MKKSLILLAILTVLLLCAVPVVLSIKNSHEQDRLTALSAQLVEAELQAKQLEAANARLVEERREMRREMHQQQVESTAAVEAATAVPTSTLTNLGTSDEKASPIGGFVAKMMEDPEMRRFIRDQQRQMLDPLYQPLIKRLGLTKEEADVFKDFLADAQMQGAQHATAMFGGPAAERAEAVETLSEEQKQNETVVREFLGEDGYAQYKEYQETLGERAQLNQFRMQTAGSEHTLTDEQTEWLLSLMKEEKRAVAVETGQMPPGSSADPADMRAMLSGEGMEPFLEMQSTVNQRVYDRAVEGLSPEQLEAFARFQTNQLQMMRVGMSMAKEMFAPEAAEGTAE